MARLLHAPRQGGGPPIEGRVATARAADDPDAMVPGLVRPEAIADAAASSAGPGALVPVMERRGEPGRRPVAVIHVSETDARWWFG